MIHLHKDLVNKGKELEEKKEVVQWSKEVGKHSTTLVKVNT